MNPEVETKNNVYLVRSQMCKYQWYFYRLSANMETTGKFESNTIYNNIKKQNTLI